MTGRDLHSVAGTGQQALCEIARIGHRPSWAGCRARAFLDAFEPSLARPATMTGRDLHAVAGAAAQTLCGIVRIRHSFL